MIWVTCSQPVVCRAKKKKKKAEETNRPGSNTPRPVDSRYCLALENKVKLPNQFCSLMLRPSLSRPSAQQDRSSMSSHEEAREYTVIETVRKCFLTRKKIKRGACRNTESWKFSPQAPRTAGSALIEKSGRSFLVLCAGTFSISVPTWCEIFSAFCAQKRKRKKRVCVGSTGVLAQAGILPGMQSCCITAGLWMICD